MKQEVVIEKKSKNKSTCKIVPGALNEFLFANQSPLKPINVVQKVKEQTIDILCKCVKPKYSGDNKISETGLVFGYVQSGKTLSFTSVIAMAADNKYRVIIILAGRNDILLEQTFTRLKQDLGQVLNRDEYLFKKNPNSDFKDKLQGALENDEQTVVITILKHQKYLNDLAKLFSDKNISKLMANLGSIIIDDESDQASLCTFAAKNFNKDEGEVDKFSAIYSGIKNLRSKLNYHSYIQYTATPQANLLVDYLDILSPKWHVVLEPGAAYTGGNRFFKEEITIKPKPVYKYNIQLASRANETVVFSDPKKDKNEYYLNLIRRIPEAEKYHPTKLNLVTCPTSLEECLKSFLIQSIILTKLAPENLGFTAMIIHLHVLQSAHIKVEGWLKLLTKRWIKDIDLPSLKLDFKKTYLEDETVTNSGLNFDDVYKNLKKFINGLSIHHISGVSKDDDDVDYNDSRSHILIGGMKLDRGYTIPNLTHTYMPRHTLGKDNADTIQQRCRFFGYKNGYIKNCRIYLPENLICQYSDYVQDEQELRKFLIAHPDINDFFDPKQNMSLSRRLAPTRQNVLKNKLVSTYFNKYMHFNPLLPSNFLDNIKISETFVKNIKEKKLLIDYNSLGRRHDLYKIDIELFIKELLEKLNFDNFIDVLVRKKIIRYLSYLKTDFGIDKCWIMNMSQGRVRERTIIEKIKTEGKEKVVILEVQNPYSGRDSAKTSKWPDEKEILNADLYKTKYKYNNEIIIQIHKIKAKHEKNPDIHGKELSTICIYFPPSLSKNYIHLNKSKDV